MKVGWPLFQGFSPAPSKIVMEAAINRMGELMDLENSARPDENRIEAELERRTSL